MRLGVRQRERHDVVDILDEMHAFARLAHRAFDFRMALVPDHHDIEAFLAHLRDFHVNLRHERAGGVEHAQATRLGLRRAPPSRPRAR